MGERTGIITFLNVYDEIGDDGHPYSVVSCRQGSHAGLTPADPPPIEAEILFR
jgi:hypothetical protein